MDRSAESSTAYHLEAQFHALYTSGIIGIVRANREQILDANDYFLRMVGYTREDLEAGRVQWPAMTPSEYAELDQRAVQELETTGHSVPFEKEYFRKDGSRVPIQIAAVIVQADPQEWVCYVLDLSAPTHAAVQERALEMVLEHVPVGVMLVDAGGRLLLMNALGRQISGSAPAPDTAVADQADVYALREPGTGRELAPEETPIARALAGETVWNYEYVFRPRGEEQDHRVRVQAVPLVAEQGPLLGAVAIFEDVTEERAREQAREEFLLAVAHDLKTPLTSIKGFAQLLQRKLARGTMLGADVVEQYLHDTVATATRTEQMLDDLLDVARMHAGEQLLLRPESVDFVDLVEQVVQRCAGISETHTVRMETPEQVLPGTSDERRLQRAIENLVVNAITYSPEGSTVTVTVTREEEGGSPWAVVEVRDTGIGIPSYDLQRIFERFYRGSNVGDRSHGSGIGLAGVKQIVELHGGHVRVESRVGIGSAFSIWLPLLAKEH